MKPPSFEISYAAHTVSCTFLLDADGICRTIVMAPKGKRRDSSRTAAKCVGAQYVASLDGSAAGGLVEMPRVGASMLFARVDASGRVSLVRTGAVTSFETKAPEDPFVESCSVETSAPDLVITPRPTELASPRATRRVDDEDPYFDDASDRTQRIPVLRPEDIAAALRDKSVDPSHELATSEYRSSAAGSGRARPTLPSGHTPNHPTLRAPHRDVLDDVDDDYATAPPQPSARSSSSSSRGMLPRRPSDHLRAAMRQPVSRARGDATARMIDVPEPAITPRAQASDIQVSRRRRGV